MFHRRISLLVFVSSGFKISSEEYLGICQSILLLSANIKIIDIDNSDYI